MQSSTKFSILLFSLLFFSSCKEEVAPEPSPCEINPGSCATVLEAKNYFAFKVGSWWVYEEETSKVRDSMCVTSYYNNEASYDFDMRIYSTLQDYYYHYFPFYPNAQGCSSTEPVDIRCLYVTRSKYNLNSGSDSGEGDCFFINYKTGSFIHVANTYDVNNILRVDNIYDTFQLNLLSFNKTFKMYEANTYIEGKQATNHYFSKDVGLIRKELLDSNQVWNLVNYHIEK